MKKIPELDGLRGLLAWWVVVGHLMAAAGYKQASLHPVLQIIRTGGLAVDVFIILSGFVIYYLIDNSRESYRRFIFRRFCRIYPVYIVLFVMSLFLYDYVVDYYRLLPWLRQDENIMDSFENWRAYRIYHVIMHAIMLHGMLPNEILPYSQGAFLPAAWSISLEWQFYLLAPIVYGLLDKSKVVNIFIALIIVGLVMVKDIWGKYIFPSFLPLRLEYFWIGAGSYYFYAYINVHHESCEPLVSNVMYLFPFAVIVFVKSIPVTIWAFVYVAIISNIFGKHNYYAPIVKLMRMPLLQHLGRISYSTYLLHVHVIWLVGYTILKNHEILSKREYFVLLAAFSMPLTYSMSLIFHYLIERPSIRYGARLSDKWQL